MTEQYSYYAYNSLLVYCCLAYIFCFATFHLVRSINYHVGNDGTYCFITYNISASCLHCSSVMVVGYLILKHMSKFPTKGDAG